MIRLPNSQIDVVFIESISAFRAGDEVSAMNCLSLSVERRSARGSSQLQCGGSDLDSYTGREILM